MKKTATAVNTKEALLKETAEMEARLAEYRANKTTSNPTQQTGPKQLKPTVISFDPMAIIQPQQQPTPSPKQQQQRTPSTTANKPRIVPQPVQKKFTPSNPAQPQQQHPQASKEPQQPTRAPETPTPIEAKQPPKSLLEGAYDERDAHSGFKDAIAEWRAAGKQPQQPPQQQRATSAATSQSGVGGGDLLHGAYDEREANSGFRAALEEWRSAGKQQPTQKQQKQQAPSTTTSGASTSPPVPSTRSQTSVGGGSLLDGQFDESESHQSFLEALKGWRTSTDGPSQPHTSQPPAVTIIHDRPTSATAKQTFLSSLSPWLTTLKQQTGASSGDNISYLDQLDDPTDTN